MKMQIVQLITLLSLGAVIYTYAIYPIFLALVASAVQFLQDCRFVVSKNDRRLAARNDLPKVAVVISAFNEEHHIRARIENLFELDYPPELLFAYIGSDGSSDATGAIIANINMRQVSSFVFERNRGKATVLNELVERVTEPIIVFSDANTFFDRAALRRLVSPFSLPEVGGVTGELRLVRTIGDNPDGLYWKFEQLLKFFEARINSLLGANGAIYAIRSSLWKPLPADTICDDFCIGMHVAVAGKRMAYAPEAWAVEESPASIRDEYQRRIRIGIGNFQALFRYPEYFYRTSISTAFAYFSHKVLRWIAPHLLILALSLSVVLSTHFQGWFYFSILQIVCYTIAAISFSLSRTGHKLPATFRVLALLFAINWAFLIASKRFVFGQYLGSWARTAR